MPRHACSAHTLTRIRTPRAYGYVYMIACTKARTRSFVPGIPARYISVLLLLALVVLRSCMPWVQRTITYVYTCASTPHPLRSARRPGDAVHAIYPTTDILPGQPRTRDALEHAQDIPNARITTQERRGR